MKQIQFFKYTTLLLLLLNIGIVTFFFLARPKPPGNGQPAPFHDRAVDLLKLDKGQHQAFLRSAEQHSRQMKAINDGQRNLLRPYFNSLVDPSMRVNADSLLQQVQLFERQKVEATYQHFKAVKELLKDDQQDHFEQFMNKALERLLLSSAPARPRPPK
jgi:hypothetical protein